MSEAELITSGFLGIETRMAMLTTEFTLIFGYLAALYFFLRHTTVGLRIFTFAILVLMLMFMWIGFIGTDVAFERYLQARVHSVQEGLLPPYWSGDTSESIGLLVSGASVLGHIWHGVAVAGCFYATFFYRWRVATRHS